VNLVPVIGARRPVAPPQAATLQSRVPQAAAIAGIGLIAVLLAYVLVHRSATPAFALVFLPGVVWLLTRSYGGLVLGVGLVLILPYWLSIGTAQASILRLASLAAVAGVPLGRRLTPKPTDYALGLLVAVIVLGWLFQYNAPHVGHVVSIELTPIAFYLGARALPPSRLRLIMLVTLFAGTIGALTVLYEYAVGHTVFHDPTGYAWNANSSAIFRPGGVFGSPPGASTVLSFVILFGFGVVRSLEGNLRLLARVSLVICGLALVLTFTRAALIAMAIATIAFLWLIRSPLLRAGRVAFFALAVSVLLILALPRLEATSTFQQGIVRPGNLAAREGYWRLALPVVLSSPHALVFGVGTGALETPAISISAPVASELASAPQVVTNSLHSQYVTTLVEQGIVGLIALCVFLAVPAAAAVRRARATGDDAYAALAAALAALAVVMTVDTAMLHGPSFAMMMLTAGIAASASTGYLRHHDERTGVIRS
jgi:O-antigen ligase